MPKRPSRKMSETKKNPKRRVRFSSDNKISNIGKVKKKQIKIPSKKAKKSVLKNGNPKENTYNWRTGRYLNNVVNRSDLKALLHICGDLKTYIDSYTKCIYLPGRNRMKKKLFSLLDNPKSVKVLSMFVNISKNGGDRIEVEGYTLRVPKSLDCGKVVTYYTSHSVKEGRKYFNNTEYDKDDKLLELRFNYAKHLSFYTGGAGKTTEYKICGGRVLDVIENMQYHGFIFWDPLC